MQGANGWWPTVVPSRGCCLKKKRKERNEEEDDREKGRVKQFFFFKYQVMEVRTYHSIKARNTPFHFHT